MGADLHYFRFVAERTPRLDVWINFGRSGLSSRMEIFLKSSNTMKRSDYSASLFSNSTSPKNNTDILLKSMMSSGFSSCRI